MATEAQVAQLRLLVAEVEQEPYTDIDLEDRIDALGSDLDLLARDIWVEKAARYAALVDVSEGGSSRSMSKLFDNATAMVVYFNSRLPAEDHGLQPSERIVRIQRLTR